MIMVFILMPFSMALADKGPDGNDRKGKYTYRKVYKSCSQADENVSSSPSVSPADKTMAEWKTVFEARNFEEFGCLDQWDALSDEDILDIYSYFYNYAADSPSPATCN